MRWEIKTREALCCGDLLEAWTVFPVRILHHHHYPWLSSLLTLLGLMQGTIIYLRYLWTKEKESTSHTDIWLVAFWKAPPKRSWLSLKNASLWVSLGHGYYGFGSTPQFLCGICSLVISGWHSSTQHRKMQFCFLLCSCYAKEIMFRGQMELWLSQAGSIHLWDISEHGPEKKSRLIFRTAAPGGAFSAVISQSCCQNKYGQCKAFTFMILLCGTADS